MNRIILIPFCVSFFYFCTIPTQSKSTTEHSKENLTINEVTGCEEYAENSVSGQSAANFDKYLFIISDKLASVTLYDLKKKQQIYTLHLTPHTEKNADGNILYHCNQCNFGNEKFAANDLFPLIYISQRNLECTKRGFNTVFRIIPTLNTKKEIIAFTMKQVQTIYFPKMTDKNCLGTPNIALDKENGYIYTYCRNNNSAAPNNQKAVICKFKTPTIHNLQGKIQKKVVLNDKDILDSFKMDWYMTLAQGGFVKNGKLIFCQGFPNRKNPMYNHVYFHVIDLKSQKQTYVKDLLNIGFKDEPEGVFFYDGMILTTINGKRIFKINYH